MFPALTGEVVLRPKKWKMAAGLVLFGTLLVVSFYMGGWKGWFVGIASAVFVAIAGASLLPGASYLRVTGEGFETCSLFRLSGLIRWSEVSGFRVAAVPPSGHKMVVYNRKRQHNGLLPQVNRGLVGASDGLPDDYGLGVDGLARWLSARRAAAGAAGEEPNE